jgi:DNA polymerase III gamma/tau subunit
MDAIVGRLETVCKGESLSAERESLELIARLSQGGMRDSLNMLEYCAGDGGVITVEKAERLLGAASRTLLCAIADAVASRDTAAALAVIEGIYMSSRDIAVFWREWIAFCRDMMIALSTRMAGVRDELLKASAERFTLPGILYLLDIFMSAESDMQRSPANARLYAEMALIRACDATLSSGNDALLARISALEDKLATGNFTAPRKEVPKPAEEELSEPSLPMSEGISKPKASAPKKEAAASESSASEKKTQTAKTIGGGRTLKGFKKWQEVVRKLSPTEGLFSPFLQMAYAYEGSDGKFYLFFENQFAVTLLTDDRKKTIANAVNAVGGTAYIPSDIIGSVQEDVGGIREPIDDLLEMDETVTTKEP